VAAGVGAGLLAASAPLTLRRAAAAIHAVLAIGIAQAMLSMKLSRAAPTTAAAWPRPGGGLGVSVIFPQPASPTASAEHHSQGDRNSLDLATP
jgi:hypothetical protein